MAEVIGLAEKAVLDVEPADRRLVLCFLARLALGVGEDDTRRLGCPAGGLDLRKCHRPVLLVPGQGEQLFRRVRHQRDLTEETAELLWAYGLPGLHPRTARAQPLPERPEGVRSVLGGASHVVADIGWQLGHEGVGTALQFFLDVREFRDGDPGELVDKMAIQVGPGLLEPVCDGLQSAYDVFSPAGPKGGGTTSWSNSTPIVWST